MARILMIAAEASSVLYAEQLIRYWSSQGQSHQYFGVGSQSMERLGFHCLGYAESMAVMGFSEVLKHYSDIKNIFNKTLAAIDQEKPDVAVLLDYPGFNLRLSKELHERNIPVIYYISPQIWAWKKKRVYQVKAYVTKMLVVFPFEVDFYKQYDVPVEYVGHPLLDELNPEYLDPTLLLAKRGRLGIQPQHKVLGLMPGSRKQEIERHLQVQLNVAEELTKKHPDLKVLLLVAPTLSKDYIQDQLENLKCPVVLLQDEPFKMIYLTDAILAASGTATLMVGLLEKPMVIMYKMSWLSALIGRLVVKGFFGLVNLLAKREIVPEVFQEKATPGVLTPLVERALYDDNYRRLVVEDLKALKQSLGTSGVTPRVAKAIETYFKVSHHNEGR
ncbi:MAG: lipid disaccharide synthase [Pseudomonadota bacterium]|jgi:lipid-A-disaccharide synthase